jgi:antitoxin ParD1/3/4
MAKNTSVALRGHFQAFVEKQVGQGRLGSASEVVRAGLRLLEEREAKFEALRKAIQEGIDSGPAEPFDFDEFIDEKESELKGA